jgi:hypothetical protein
MDKIICEHCLQPTIGKVYRVTSEDAGVVILDLVVCSGCCREAEKLGLKTNEFGTAIPGLFEFDRNNARR